MTGNTAKVRSLLLTALMVMSVFAGATAFAGSVGAANEPLDTPGTYYSGRIVSVDASGLSEETDSVQIREVEEINDGDLELSAPKAVHSLENGNVSFSLGDRSGKVVLTTDSGTVLDVNGGSASMVTGTNESQGIIEITNHNFEASFEDDTVVDNGHDAKTMLNIGADRSNYKVAVTSDDLNQDKVLEIFNDNSDYNAHIAGDSVVLENVKSSSEVTANFIGVKTGDHDFTFKVNDSAVEVTDNITVESAGDKKATIGESHVNTARGDIAAITVNLENSNTGMLRIGNEDTDFFQYDIKVTDGNDDGKVTVYFNTYRTSNNTATDVNDSVRAGAGTDDTAVVQDGSLLGDEPIAQGDYELRSDVSDLSDPDDVTSLTVGPRSTDSAQTWIKPGNSENEGNATELTNVLTQRSNVALGDKAVVQVKASGIFGALTTADGSTTNYENFTLTVTETGDNKESNTNADSLKLSDNDFSIIKDGKNNTFYAVIDTDDLNTADGEGDGLGEWNAKFTVKEEYELASDDQSVSTTFTVEQEEVDLNGGNDMTVPQGEDNISGETNLAPGTDLTLIAQSTGIFYKNADATVSEDGTFSGSFDFSEYDNATEFDVFVQGMKSDTQISGVVDQNAGQTTTTTTTTTTTSSEPSTTTSTTPGDDTTTTTTSSDGQPGFGVAISVVALLAAALLALRREN
ncbi:DUF7827 domain-containing protein [Haladaptatus halobius]|uniref:DUF7827 domain-containing protein n=1 Tax=Haladaptatus halobius TaxID=2884875 RepID=UPI001D0AF010|nr:BGTF surface domain-containing protein [Haladaptatus halobius]